MTLILYGVVSFMSLKFAFGLEAPGTHLIEGWMGPRARLEVVAERNRSPSLPLPGTEPRFLARSLVYKLSDIVQLVGWFVG
jgi:hypothetical protein